MSPDHHHHGAFAAALLDPERDVPDGVKRANGLDPLEAFNIYRNNVVVSLVDALKAAFPITSHLLGEGLQKALMGDFVRQHPPKSAVMSAYGEHFPAYLAQHPATKAKPFLANMALLERYRTQAYHAADASVLDGTALAAIDPDELAEGSLVLHPAVRLLSSPFPVASIHAIEMASLAGEDPSEVRTRVRMDRGEAILVTRPAYQVNHQVVDQGVFAFLQACGKGQTFNDALDAGFEASDSFDPQHALSVCLAGGVFTAFQAASNPCSTHPSVPEETSHGHA